MERINWKRDLELILNGELKVRYGGSFKLRLLENSILENKCSRCGIENWLGEKISLELDHIDGDNWNNKRENIRLLCPNCHAITDNYKGKNRKDLTKLNNKEPKRGIIFYKKDIIELYKQGFNISQILKKLDLNIGGNYLMIYKIFEENGIEIPIKEDKAILLKDVEVKRLENKVKKLKENIELIKNSDIDFNKKGWGTQVSKLLNITPSASLRWVKRNLPEFANNCWQHSDNKNIIN
jgi:hypothetical protein